MEANKNISVVLKNILEKYVYAGDSSILGIDFDSDEVAMGFKNYKESIADDRISNLNLLLLVLNTLENKNILEKVVHNHRTHYSELIIKDQYVIHFPEDFLEKTKNYLEEISNKKDNAFFIYLDADGSFWHSDKKKFCYPMKANCDRFLIIKYLIENKGYQSSYDISYFLNDKGAPNVRTEINKIRAEIKKYLGIDGKELILSKTGGYKINPKYNIVFSKE